MPTLRQIVYSNEARQDVDAGCKIYRRLEDCVRALEWRLCHRPNDGAHRSGRFWIYRQTGAVSLDLPEITVLYSFTDDEVEFHALMIRPAS